MAIIGVKNNLRYPQTWQYQVPESAEFFFFFFKIVRMIQIDTAIMVSHGFAVHFYDTLRFIRIAVVVEWILPFWLQWHSEKWDKTRRFFLVLSADWKNQTGNSIEQPTRQRQHSIKFYFCWNHLSMFVIFL